MIALIAWWDLSRSSQTVDTLRDYLEREGVTPWEGIEGLRLKFWVSDPEGGRWGAVMLWEGAYPPGEPLPPNRASELIGYPPTVRMRADVEAVAGPAGLGGVDLALEGAGPVLEGGRTW